MSESLWTALPSALVCLLTLLGGLFGLRLSRTTSDFYVAGRIVSPWWNASAVGGEYISAASFLGVAGLIYANGFDMLWLPVGYTLGFVVLLALVAAPLRRSGAYTVPDFAEARLDSRGVRWLCSLVAVLIGWLYLLPQLYGAGLTLRLLTGVPSWVGVLVVSVIVTLNVLAGGLRSVTLVQAAQFWFKLLAIAIPAFVLVWWWLRRGGPVPTFDIDPHLQATPAPERLYTVVSTLLALCLGTMGLPHVIVRFYTNPDGAAARRTTVVVIGLLGLFYVFPPVYASLGRAFLPRLPPDMNADAIVLMLPRLVAEGPIAAGLVALLAAGAFAAFLSTSSGLAVAVAGIIDQDLVRPRIERLTGGDGGQIQGFRVAALIAMIVPLGLIPLVGDLGLATTVTLAFTVAASTLSPLLILGVWWRGLSVPGAACGMIVGAVLSVTAVIASLGRLRLTGWPEVLLSQPAAWCVPTAFAVAVLVSLASPARIPSTTLATMARLHTPETVGLQRSRP